ncbi:MAG: AbrB/MazE/SpoVT family DNA-binding domain-containing protein, partial [Clostridiales bacterium]|nr:AbrB/MazE/SpoVT family DNA-binding domain-containing protein [Clostridiales bacterium]
MTTQGGVFLKATGIVRRIDDLGRVVIPKEIRRTLRIREGDPLLTTLTKKEKGIFALSSLADRVGKVIGRL